MGNINTSTWDLYGSGDLEFEDTPKDGGSSFGAVSGQERPHVFESQDSISNHPSEDKLDVLNSNTEPASGGVSDNSNRNQKSSPSSSGNTLLSPRPNKPNDSKHSWRKPLLITVILLLLLGSITTLALYRNSVAKYNNLKSAQSALQQELLKSDEASAEELKELGDKVSIIRGELDKDIPEDLQEQYQDLLLQINSLTQSSNQAVASSAQDLLAKLTNQAGAGISLSPDGKTITNSGVLSVNSQTGNLSIQGTANQTNVTQNGSTTTIGTAQDIAQTSSPTFNNQTLTGNGNIQGGLTVGGTTTTNNLTIQSSGTQNGYALCDASNNCGYSGAGSSYVQGGNSFGNPAYLGTNDNNSLNLETNGTTRLTIDTAGNTSLTGNLTTPGSVSASSLSGNGSGVTNVDATALNGNTAGNNSGQISLNNGTVNSNLNSDLLDGQHGSYYQNASNINAGTLSDARLSSNVTLQGNSFNGINQLVQLNGSGYLPSLNGSLVTNVDALTLQGNSASYFTNASNIASGTLSDLRLSSNIPLKNATNTFTGTNNFAGITATGILQGGYSVCDASNNCNYATNSQFASAILQGGNSFGTTMRIGTNDSQSLVLKSNNVDAMTIASDGRIGINSTPSAVYRLSVNADARAMFVGHVSIPVLDNSFSLNVSNYYQSHGAIGIRLNAGTTAPHIRSYLDSTKVFEVGSAGQGYFAGNTSIGTTSDLGQLAVVNTSTTQAVMVVRGASGQAGDLQQWQNSSGTVLSRVASNGAIQLGFNVALQAEHSGGGGFVDLIKRGSGNSVYVGNTTSETFLQGNNYTFLTTSSSQGGIRLYASEVTKYGGIGYLGTSSIPWNQLFLQSVTNSATPLYVKGALSQTANLTEWQDNSGSILGSVNNLGNLTMDRGFSAISAGVAGATYSIGYNGVSIAAWRSDPVWESGSSVLSPSAGKSIFVKSSAVGDTALKVKAFTGQTADLQQWQNSSGTVLSRITSDGRLAVTDASDGVVVASVGSQLVGAGINLGRGKYDTSSYGLWGNPDSATGDGNITIAPRNKNNSNGAYVTVGQTSSSTDRGYIRLQAGYYAGSSMYGRVVISTGSTPGANSFVVNENQQVGIGTATFGASNKFTVNSNTTSDNSASVQINTGGTSNKGIVVQGITSQSGDLLQAQDSTGAVLAKIDADGDLTARSGDFGSSSVTYGLFSRGSSAAVLGQAYGGDGIRGQSLTNGSVALAATGCAGCAGDLLQARDSVGTVLARITASGDLTVKNASVEGAYITFSNNIRGYNVSVAASATSQTVSFGTAHPDANYAVFCTPDWNTSCYVSNKTTNGFTLNYGTAAPAAQQVDWFVAR